MEILNDLDVQRLLEDSQDLIGSTGTTRLLLRQPMQPSTTVKKTFALDPDYKTPVTADEVEPYRERQITAKIRSMNDYEVSATGVGELQIGDLVATIDPSYLEDPIQPVQALDELRFVQKTYVAGAGFIEDGWDFIIRGVHPAWAKDTCVQLKLILRRKKVKTAGGSGLSSV